MKLWLVLLLVMLVPGVVPAQNKPLQQHEVVVPFSDSGNKILAHQVLEGGNLLLIGLRSVKILDLNSGRIIESHQLDALGACYLGAPVVSPDRRRIVIPGNEGCGGKENKIKRPATVWDLETEKQVAVLDKTAKPIGKAFWSANGRTLITSSDGSAPSYSTGTSIEVAFWDGETFAFKNSLPEEKINWWYVTKDGAKCLYSLGPVKNFLYLVKYLGPNGGPLKVWDIDSGRIGQTFAAIEAGVPRQMRAIDVSPNEEVLTLVAQPPKSKETARRQVVVEIEKNTYQLKTRYEIQPTPHIWEWGVDFNPDGKYFALLAKKNLQIYETSTGEKKYEIGGAKELPAFWLNDNKVLLFYFTFSMEAMDLSGRVLYKQPLIYESYDESESGNITVLDSTVIKPHPRRNLLLTASNQYVKVIDSVTGELLQTLVAPYIDNSKKKPRLTNKRLVSAAEWSTDGATAFVIDYERKNITLWRFEN
ncbi:MAG TPA: hypothetical protein VLL54_18780 [Pyrinomonadaceae bacterium]|nr:hypothetical protein [Pyrinomonadaceae bacterium]